MRSTTYEQRLKSFKQQKYNLLLTKQDLINSDLNSDQKEQLLSTTEETLRLVNSAINTCTRIIEYSLGIEEEIKSYKIIEKKLCDIMLDNQFVEASTKMNSNKLNEIGEHLSHLEQLLKYRK